MSSAYRSAYHHLVGMRLAALRRTQEEVEPVLPRLRRVGAARLARAAAGTVGLAAAAATVAGAFRDDGGATYALIGGGLLAMCAYVGVRALAAFGGLFVRRGRWRIPELTGQLDVDLARIDASHPTAALARRVERLEIWSTALPLAAISLLAPLTLHFLVGLLFGWTSSPYRSTAEEFTTWLRISLVIVGHAHLALMACAIAFARKMKRLDTLGVAGLMIHAEWAKALGIAVAVAAVPGIILLALPPVIAALTGLVFVPAAFISTRRRVLDERAVVALASEPAEHTRVAPDAAEVAAAYEGAWIDDGAWLQEGVHPAATSTSAQLRDTLGR